jgi:hypothetical protein
MSISPPLKAAHNHLRSALHERTCPRNTIFVTEQSFRYSAYYILEPDNIVADKVGQE